MAFVLCIPWLVSILLKLDCDDPLRTSVWKLGSAVKWPLSGFTFLSKVDSCTHDLCTVEDEGIVFNAVTTQWQRIN